jgi:DNA-binding response OmpR family regulator
LRNPSAIGRLFENRLSNAVCLLEALLERKRMRRRILLVDDEVAVLLTLKAVLEISGFDVDTAASAREGVSKLHTREYQMLITDMRMESDAAGIEVIKAARSAAYHPAVALLTAFPVAEEDWQEMGADRLLVKPMHTQILLKQIEDLIHSHEDKLAKLAKLAKRAPQSPTKSAAVVKSARAATKAPARRLAAKQPARKSSVATPAKKVAAKKSAKSPKKTAAAKRPARKSPAAVRPSPKKAAKRP